MNCATHAEIPSEAYCTQCGRALCTECIRKVASSVYCEDCLAASLHAADKSAGPAGPAAQTIGGASPDTAFVLGLIPGVGAIYNGEYFKAAIHVLIFSMLMSLGGLLAVAFYFYMPFEAYYTAKKRKLAGSGIHLETPVDRFHQQLAGHLGNMRDKEFWGGIALIILGGLYLLDSFGVFSFRAMTRFWPVLLIAAGTILLLRSREKKN